MFKNRSLQMTVVKNSKPESDEPKSSHRLNEAEIALIKSTAKTVAIAAVLMIVSIKTTDAICEIAINAAPKN